MSLLNTPHEIRLLQNNDLDLRAVLSIHKYGKQGIAIGGCRIREYSSQDEAIEDAKKLSTNMTLKYQVLGMGFGGLKLVVYEFNQKKRNESFAQIGKWIQEYGGNCYIATDSGSTVHDMVNVHSETDFVIDLPKNEGGFGSFTPLLTQGVFYGLQSALEFVYEDDCFNGKSAYVSGFGTSGFDIAQKLIAQGTTVTGFDMNKEKNNQAHKEGVVINNDYTSEKYDIFVPCSVGHLITPSTVTALNTSIIGGSANHPIHPEVELELQAFGITYLPDFVISSGAIVLDDLILAEQPCSLEEGLERTKQIYTFSQKLLRHSRSYNLPTTKAALELLGY